MLTIKVDFLSCVIWVLILKELEAFNLEDFFTPCHPFGDRKQIMESSQKNRILLLPIFWLHCFLCTVQFSGAAIWEFFPKNTHFSQSIPKFHYPLTLNIEVRLSPPETVETLLMSTWFSLKQWLLIQLFGLKKNIFWKKLKMVACNSKAFSSGWLWDEQLQLFSCRFQTFCQI